LADRNLDSVSSIASMMRGRKAAEVARNSSPGVALDIPLANWCLSNCWIEADQSFKMDGEAANTTWLWVLI
jgi:hypothetical protein